MIPQKPKKETNNMNIQELEGIRVLDGILEGETLEETTAMAYGVFSALLKNWLLNEHLHHDSVVGRCRAVLAYHRHPVGEERPVYTDALEEIVKQFMTDVLEIIE